MKRICLLTLTAAWMLVFIGQTNATTILDFTSGIYSDELGVDPGIFPPFDVDTYTQDGFKLQVLSAGNHIDPGLIGDLGFHNDSGNPTVDNDLILTFSGGAFDFVGLDIAGFGPTATSLDLTPSSGSGVSFTTVGLHTTPTFTNVTSVTFSITPPGDGSVGFYKFKVNPIPEPGTFALFGVGIVGLLGYGWRRKGIS